MKYVVILVIAITVVGCDQEELKGREEPATLSSLAGEWRCNRFDNGFGLQQTQPHAITVFYESGLILNHDESFVPVKYLTVEQMWQSVSENDLSGYTTSFELDTAGNHLTLKVQYNSNETLFQFDIESFTGDELVIRHTTNPDYKFYLDRHK